MAGHWIRDKGAAWAAVVAIHRLQVAVCQLASASQHGLPLAGYEKQQQQAVDALQAQGVCQHMGAERLWLEHDLQQLEQLASRVVQTPGLCLTQNEVLQHQQVLAMVDSRLRDARDYLTHPRLAECQDDVGAVFYGKIKFLPTQERTLLTDMLEAWRVIGCRPTSPAVAVLTQAVVDYADQRLALCQAQRQTTQQALSQAQQTQVAAASTLGVFKHKAANDQTIQPTVGSSPRPWRD